MKSIYEFASLSSGDTILNHPRRTVWDLDSKGARFGRCVPCRFPTTKPNPCKDQARFVNWYCLDRAACVSKRFLRFDAAKVRFLPFVPRIRDYGNDAPVLVASLVAARYRPKRDQR